MRAGWDACPCRGCSFYCDVYSMRYARADTAVRPYAECINGNHHSHFVTSVTSRCAVECGVGGPQAGHSTFRWLQASPNSAAGRAGTVHDGHYQHR